MLARLLRPFVCGMCKVLVKDIGVGLQNNQYVTISVAKFCHNVLYSNWYASFRSSNSLVEAVVPSKKPFPLLFFLCGETRMFKSWSSFHFFWWQKVHLEKSKFCFSIQLKCQHNFFYCSETLFYYLWILMWQVFFKQILYWTVIISLNPSFILSSYMPCPYFMLRNNTLYLSYDMYEVCIWGRKIWGCNFLVINWCVFPIIVNGQVAIFSVLSMVLRRKPDVIISLLPNLQESSKYKGQDKLPLLAWMVAQVSQ